MRMSSRVPALIAALIVAALATTAPAVFGAGTDEPPKPVPKPAPKPDPKPEPKSEPKADTKAMPTSAIDPDYEAGKQAVAVRDWGLAIDLMSRALARDPSNANIHNYLGFSNRNNGDWETAIRHYRIALNLNPEHRGANEYLGHAYLLRGNMQLAEAQVARLERICGRGCEEYASLSAAVREYRTHPK